ENDGMIGDIYSMGLALQVLGATSKFYAPRTWDCTQAFAVVYSHDYQLPMAIAQVLPALLDRSYLEAAEVDCTTSADTPFLPCAPWHCGHCAGCPPCPSPLPAASITVHYSVINQLQGKHFSYTTSVQVSQGSTLLKVLQAAEEKEPENFSFQTEQTSWGLMVVSIHGLAANSDDRTYWQFLSDEDALQQGVGTYTPWDGEHIKAVFSTY
ncbi:IF factor, partial [Corythaixoides concolor]|nr:IF factor [Corythaixoides concolor]